MRSRHADRRVPNRVIWSMVTLVGLFFVCSSTAGAQEVAARASDSVQVANAIYKELFAGIKLNAGDSTTAHRLIVQTFVRQLSLPMREGASRARFRALQEQRDSVLRLLIVSPEDRATFDRRASKLRLPPQ